MQQLNQELQNEQKLRKSSSISSHSISSSSFGASDLSHSSANSIGYTHNRGNVVTSQSSFNKEIKSLLDIAENRTRILCKVYDSQENVQINDRVETLVHRRPNLIQRNSNRNSYTCTLNENSTKPNDYKSIINLNYLKSNKKQSNVITKVKLWDQLFETGQLNSDKWDKEFCQQSK